MAEEVEGWAFPTRAARKCHYFTGPERRSLCGRYGLFIVPPRMQISPETGEASEDDCLACRRKLEAAK